jgi:(p)ppGpp synthase/HD superfamily hydrolase
MLTAAFSSVARLLAARKVAETAHKGQLYGDRPYLDHLDAVVETLKKFGHTDPDILTAGYLHDTLEDTSLTKDQLASEFGQRVADLVDACTDGPGKNRKERKERPYTLIPQTPGALAIKLADRIANIQSAKKTNPGLLSMYRLEQPVFLSRLYDGSHRPMFDRLKELIR